MISLLNAAVPVLRKTMSCLAVSNRKIHCFCFSSFGSILILQELHRCLALRLIPLKKQFSFFNFLPDLREHTHGCSRVKITSLFECRQHCFAIRNVSQDTQLQLSIISHYEFLAFFCTKCLPNLVDILFEGWLILEVWFSCRQPPCLGIDVD